MTESFEEVIKLLRQLPGLGSRSAERIALHLLVEKRSLLANLLSTLGKAGEAIGACEHCGNIAELGVCGICMDPKRDAGVVCVVESVPDLVAIEKSGAFKGVYHVLNGKISPVKGVKPEDVNLPALKKRIHENRPEELILALSNDIEGQATCYYIQNTILGDKGIRVSRIGFGLPSGSGVIYADSATLKSALDSRREF